QPLPRKLSSDSLIGTDSNPPNFLDQLVFPCGQQPPCRVFHKPKPFLGWINIALTDLRKAQMPVADQLVSEIPRHPSDVDRKSTMVEIRTIPTVIQFSMIAHVDIG